MPSKGIDYHLYQQQLCMDTGCCLEDQLEVVDNRDE